MRLKNRTIALFAVCLMMLTFAVAAPAQDLCEFLFSTEVDFRTNNPFGISQVGHGDLLSDQSCVIKTNNQLIANLGIMVVPRGLGLDAVTDTLFSISDPPPVLFSLERDVWSETLGWIRDGDLLSEQGMIERTNEQLLHSFEPASISLEGFGLDAVQRELVTAHVRTGYLFSVEVDFFSFALNQWVSHGDLLAEAGFIYRTYDELLGSFNPVDSSGFPLLDHDFGLDAVYVRQDDTVWFSVETGFMDSVLGWVDEGDVLSEEGTIVRRINDLLVGCDPLNEVRFGLDSLHHFCAPCEIDIDRELFIHDLSVVNDPVRTTCATADPASCGPWTFGALMAAVAGTVDPHELSDFVLHWLGDTGEHWLDDNLVINDFSVPARALMQTEVINPWKALSLPGDPLNFAEAPFRLLAILNRPDLRNDDLEMDLVKAGEGRFVFGVLPGGQTSEDFTIIFEFKLPGETCEDVKDWQVQWHALGSLPLGTDEYNAALENITNQFATIGADPTAPNRTALSQLRTNEIELVNFQRPWELREFRVLCPGDSECPSGGEQVCPGVTGQLLTETTVEQEPDFDMHHESAELIAYLIEFADEISQGTYRIPCRYPDLDTPFRAGSSLVTQQWLPNPGSVGVDPEVRDKFALNTCSGCHRTETGTDFVHIEARTEFLESEPSAFLEADLELRADDMCTILTTPCDSAGDGHSTSDGASMLGRPESMKGRVH